MKKTYVGVVAILLVGLMLAACGDSTSATTGTSAGSTTAAGTTGAVKNNNAEIAALKNLDGSLTSTKDALKKGDVAAAQTAYKKFDDGWYDVEVSVRARNKDLYRDLENNKSNVGRELLRNDKPVANDVLPLVETLQQKYGQAIRLAETSPAAATTKAPEISGAEVEKATEKVSTYLVSGSDDLVKNTDAFVAAVKSRDVAKSKAAYEIARFDYEKIEFLAEAFSDFDVAIDARANDFPKGEQDDNWTGFHPLEKAVFVDGKLDDRTDKLADKLSADIKSLNGEIKSLKIDPTVAINGAAELIEEIQSGKITGEEERYSHTDLNDFRANLQSAKFIYETYGGFVAQRNPVLDSDLRDQFSSVEKAIEPFFTNGKAMDYSKVDDGTRKVMAQKVEALADSFSRVAGTLGLKV